MSPRFAAVLLFAAAFCAFPLPLFGLDGVVVPAARFAQLASVLAALAVLEGTGGAVVPLLLLLASHAVVYTLLLAGAAWGLGRFGLPKLPPRLRDHVVVIVSTLLIMIGGYGQLYDTRFHHASAHAQLFELYW